MCSRAHSDGGTSTLRRDSAWRSTMSKNSSISTRDPRRKPFCVHGFDIRMPNQLDTLGGELGEVGLPGSRIRAEVFGRRELGGIDEDRDLHPAVWRGGPATHARYGAHPWSAPMRRWPCGRARHRGARRSGGMVRTTMGFRDIAARSCRGREGIGLSAWQWGGGPYQGRPAAAKPWPALGRRCVHFGGSCDLSHKRFTIKRVAVVIRGVYRAFRLTAVACDSKM